MPYRITENCNGCGACKRICPAGAISGERKAVHAVDADACIECGECEAKCPQHIPIIAQLIEAHEALMGA